MIYRNHILLGLAALAPQCFACDRRNDGTVVAAHSNQSRDGKGMAIKASDAAVAFCCHACHTEIDQGSAPASQRLAIWERAHRATLRWLIESGHLVAFVEPQDPPPPKPKRKAKISSGRKIQSPGFAKSATPQKIPSRSFPKRAK